MISAANTVDALPSLQELLKENRGLKRKLQLAEAGLERARQVAATQKRVGNILNDSLKRELQYFNLVLENTTSILLLLDFDGRFAYASDAFLAEASIASFGLINGMHFEEVLRPIISEKNLASFADTVREAESNKSSVAYEEQIDFGLKGLPRTFSAIVTPMLDESGESTGIMALFNDITEINDAMNEAKRANAVKSEFLANMSHEIRTPMNAIIGMTAIGKSASDTERKDYCLNKIEDASSHLLRIINDILDMSKIEANKFELASADFSFSEMLRRVLNVVGLHAEEKRQRLVVNIDKTIPERLSGDDHRLAQVITNLLGNAVKFTPDGGSIDLSARFIGEEDGVCTVQVEVSDTGIGISPEQKERIFQPFSQAESSTTRKFGGSGLGLVISKNIVEMMGGDIWLESAPGEGSTFAFTVRLARGAASAEDSGGENGQTVPVEDFQGKRILLAEDVEINREIVIALLEPTLLQVDCASNGIEAVNMFEEAPDAYDMIFMDVQMPEMDGYEATRRIRALPASNASAIPVVAMTANVFREDIERCLEAGMNDHIGKPLSLEGVLETLNKYLY